MPKRQKLRFHFEFHYRDEGGAIVGPVKIAVDEWCEGGEHINAARYRAAKTVTERHRDASISHETWETVPQGECFAWGGPSEGVIQIHRRQQ